MRIVRNGEFSVDMFFVLSGFLIAFVLLREHRKEGRISVLRFYLRRWLRIFPAMAVVLAIYWGVTVAVGCDTCYACNSMGWMNLLFVNNLFAPSVGGCMQWTWSVATEMQFYVFSPFIMMVVARWRRIGFVLLAFLVCSSLDPWRSDYAWDLSAIHQRGVYMDAIMIKPYTRFGPLSWACWCARCGRPPSRGCSDCALPRRPCLGWLHALGRLPCCLPHCCSRCSFTLARAGRDGTPLQAAAPLAARFT